MQSSGPVFGASAPGNTHLDNEDSWGTAGALTWVLDGAARPPGAPPVEPAAAFVARVSDALAEHADSDLPLRAIVRQVIETVVTDEVLSPSATLALTRRTGTTLEWLLLGDASIIVESVGGLVHLTDSRLATVCATERAAWAAAVAAGGEDAADRWLELFDAEQEMRNTAGGYWVLADAASAADHALTGKISNVGDVVLATDGVIDGDGTAYVSLNDLHERARRDPAGFISDLHRSLNASGRQRIDDATVVISQS